jgi:PPM family protein phosphatase
MIMGKGRHDDETAELPAMHRQSRQRWPDTGSARVRVDLSAATHQGKVRKINEDHYYVLRFGRFLESVMTSLPASQVPIREEELGYGLLVADGMGGAAGGEVASRSAIGTLLSLVLNTHDWVLGIEQEAVTEVMRRGADRFLRIHESLRAQAASDPRLASMGTTMTVAASLGNSLIIGHIGDSRAYILRDGGLLQVTRDHTVVQALVDAGQLQEDQAQRHPSRHILTALLGGGGPSSKGDFHHAWLMDGDQLLLCTDGLNEMLADSDIAAILLATETAHESCQALIDAALAKGGRDNVTVALARYQIPK